MIVGSIKEDLTLEKRVSITPDSAKNIINLGLNSTPIDEDITPEGTIFLEFSFTDYDGQLVVLYEFD